MLMVINLEKIMKIMNYQYTILFLIMKKILILIINDSKITKDLFLEYGDMILKKFFHIHNFIIVIELILMIKVKLFSK